MMQVPEELRKRIGRSGEDYLEAIGHLCHKNGAAQVSDIAQMLGVKKPSVTAAMRKLADMGLIEYHQYAPITLTREGASVSAPSVSVDVAYEYGQSMNDVLFDQGGVKVVLTGSGAM